MPTGRGASRIFAIATATAEKEGYRSFKKGTKGYAERSRIAEAIARKAHTRAKK